MFQEAALLPWLTARRNVELALQLAGRAAASAGSAPRSCWRSSASTAQGDKRAARAVRRHAPARLAGPGAAPPRGSEAEPSRLLLMDEPFAALDAITRDVLHEELLRVWQATGTTILFVTHDVREAVRLGQRVVLLSSRPGHGSSGSGGSTSRAAPHRARTTRSPDAAQVITSHAA